MQENEQDTLLRFVKIYFNTLLWFFKFLQKYMLPVYLSIYIKLHVRVSRMCVTLLDSHRRGPLRDWSPK